MAEPVTCNGDISPLCCGNYILELFKRTLGTHIIQYASATLPQRIKAAK